MRPQDYNDLPVSNFVPTTFVGKIQDLPTGLLQRFQRHVAEWEPTEEFEYRLSVGSKKKITRLFVMTVQQLNDELNKRQTKKR